MHAERGCGAAALLEVIISLSLWFCDGGCIFILTSVILTRSLCKFLLIEPIFYCLWLCRSKFCWCDCCSRLGFHFLQSLVWGIRWYHLPIFFSVFQSFCWSCILSSILGSIQQPFSLGDVAILYANFHFIFLCVLFQHRIFAHSIFSIASSVLLFMYSIQSSSSITVVSISSSASSSNETSLSTSSWDFVLWPSPFSSSVLHISLTSMSSFSSLDPISCFSIFLYFLFVWMMSHSILRCVDWIILSCSLLSAHVPAP